ncbi:MAG: right-handed parallel beta-helix repeat-containing protein, partial [Actinobacteria bacterium]|nr:right-handed parallel beta-helix repeat-containing protein [Actinomycetota bacterium]
MPLPSPPSTSRRATAGPTASRPAPTADSQNNQIGRITPTGEVGLFTLATPSYPRQITAGPDGRLWFSMQAPARIGAFAPFAPVPSPPDIRSIVPPDSTTDGGTTVLITGYGIGSATQVSFGTTPATSFHAIGPGQIEAVAPPHAAGEVDVTVVTPSGTTAPSEGSKFFYSSLACGKVITQSTTLGTDIGPCYHDGVIVKADNITLDLGGKRVFSFSRPSDGNAAGIRLPMRTGVTVKNGTVSGFDAGVVLHGGGSNTLTNLTLKDNIGPDTVTTTLGDGIFIEASAANKVINNTISHNGIFDGIGIYEPQSNSNIVENNVVEKTVGPSDRGPAGQGIIINGASEGATPTHIESTRVANNVVRDNASAGIANVNHVRGSILANMVVGNGATNSVGNGIGVSVGFLWKGTTQMLIKDNKVHGNGVDGIRIAANATGG